MGDKTGIEWTDATWNPIRGCSRVSEGCRHCYAERVAARFSGPGMPYEGLPKVSRMLPVQRRWNGTVRMVAEHLADPLRWKKPRRVFVNSMSDLFHESLTNEQIAAVFGVMAAAPQHTFQVLTKRAARMRAWFEWAASTSEYHAIRRCGDEAEKHGAPVYVKRKKDGRSPWNDSRCSWPMPNVWLGVSVENQSAADERISELLATPAAVRWISAEPLIGAVDLSAFIGGPYVTIPGDTVVDSYNAGLSWVVAGCESGPGARPCDVKWLRWLRDQCRDAGVPFFLKQAVVVPDDGDREDPREVGYPSGPLLTGIQCGDGSHRKASGVIGLPYLDGVQHAAFPAVPRG